jgi:hypothetical protein
MWHTYQKNHEVAIAEKKVQDEQAKLKALMQAHVAQGQDEAKYDCIDVDLSSVAFLVSVVSPKRQHSHNIRIYLNV